jgi:predicted nuclease with TOPRIM domain
MIQELEKEYQKDIDKLKNKLKWYAENQELLDKGTRKLKTREDEIHKLKMRIEELQTEVLTLKSFKGFSD